MTGLERYFEKFRKNIIGHNVKYDTPFGSKEMVYADWIASGRLYGPIEDKLRNLFGPMVGNTHSEASETGTYMTHSYHMAHRIIKQHCNANAEDVIITTGFGMTDAVSKMQRIIGLRIPEQAKKLFPPTKMLEKPVVFLTHMEHHSNQTSWLENEVDVVVMEPGEGLLVDPEKLRTEIEKYKNRKIKIGSFSACSNVTGVIPPYYELARIMHEFDGYCFIDFAASAPYLEINMHPENPLERLDAIYFSPHKFLGGPGSSGVLIFNKDLYKNVVPDQPGGGTVKWTNRWGKFAYLDDIEQREDGGTPGFLQAIRTALCIRLKEEMSYEKIMLREKELLSIAFRELRQIKGLHILADNVEDRLGVISFYVDNIHFNLIVKLLNDMYGIQTRGGCSCAGTYGHFLLHVDETTSRTITDKIDHGDLSEKPGWIRLSIHPVMKDQELLFIIESLKDIVNNIEEYSKDYIYSIESNEFYHINFPAQSMEEYRDIFNL